MIFDMKLTRKIFPVMFSYRVIIIYIGRIKSLIKLTDGNWSDCISKDYEELTISINKNKYVISGWYLGDLPECFLGNHYTVSDFTNKSVLDIGSNICDSSISFINQGAKYVIAVEPSKINYLHAMKNITNNKLVDEITLLNMGLSSVNELLYIEDGSGLAYNLTTVSNGVPLQVHTLEFYANMITDKNPILKMDCEGAEYDSLLKTSDDVIKKFETIILEFHNGHQVLVDRLESLGFVCNVDVNMNQKAKNMRGKTGHIIAQHNSGSV